MNVILSIYSSRFYRKWRSVSYRKAVNTTRKEAGCTLPLSARNCIEISLADRLTMQKKWEVFSVWSAEVTSVTAYTLGEPTVLCSRMDESTIVGYYTLKKCLSRNLTSRKSLSKRRMTHGKK